MRRIVTGGLLSAVLALGACDKASVHVSAGATDVNFSFQGETLVLSHGGAPDAQVTAAGDLRIGDRNLTVTADQRTQLAAYYAAVHGLERDGIATGKAGAAVGLAAASAAIDGLLHGGTRDAGAEIERKAADVRAKAQKVCADFRAARAAGAALVASLPEFAPYQAVSADDSGDCHVDSKR